jgi:hypothetical protein
MPYKIEVVENNLEQVWGTGLYVTMMVWHRPFSLEREENSSGGTVTPRAVHHPYVRCQAQRLV